MPGRLLLQLVNLPQEIADRAGVGFELALDDSPEQAVPIASQGQERPPERGVFGGEYRFRVARTPDRDGNPDGVPSGLGYRAQMTQ
jgi:hypothetical protein